MWEKLDNKNKNKYKKYVLNFASLSEVFSQKNISKDLITPIINSKYQEVVFQDSFGAIAEDINNTSYDVSLILEDNEKYLIGLKTFGITSGDQKIAQFKAKNSEQNWGNTINLITENAKIARNKKESDKINHELYLELAQSISRARNKRIASSRAQVRGFKDTLSDVNTVYHVLMPSTKNKSPQIMVGETDYLPIDLESLEILGSTTEKKPENFKFKDKHHTYKYTHSDSQLHMSFNNNEIVVEVWDVEYMDNPFRFFQDLQLQKIESKQLTPREHEAKIIQTFSWLIVKENEEVPEKSGYNAFNAGIKMGKDDRRKKMVNITKKYSTKISKNEMEKINQSLKEIFFPEGNPIKEMDTLRKELIKYVVSLNNKELLIEIESAIYRSVNEVYIPIPLSRKFHDNNPDFFGKNIGTFKKSLNKREAKKLALNPADRKFDLKFLASGEIIEAYINQDDGKSIQSFGNQDILGKWLLREVFQLKPSELLTKNHLYDIGINGVRISKFDKREGLNELIGFEFIWIDEDSLPEDYIEEFIKD